MGIPTTKPSTIHSLLLLLLLLSNVLLSSATAHHATETSLPGAMLNAVSSLVEHFPMLALRQSLHSALAPSPSVPKGLASSTGGKGSYRKMASEFVRVHNAVRSVFREAPLKWNKKLAKHAQAWSDSLRGNCKMVHENGAYGENLFWGSGWDWRAFDAVKSWAGEVLHYDIENNTCKEGKMCGHFTQVAWNKTRRIGCGRSECFGGGVIISCFYDPAGNFVGERPFELK